MIKPGDIASGLISN